MDLSLNNYIILKKKKKKTSRKILNSLISRKGYILIVFKLSNYYYFDKKTCNFIKMNINSIQAKTDSMIMGSFSTQVT